LLKIQITALTSASPLIVTMKFMMQLSNFWRTESDKIINVSLTHFAGSRFTLLELQ